MSLFQYVIDGWHYLLKGGFVMYPLFACAIISLAVMIERFIFLRRAAGDNEVLVARTREYLRAGRVQDVLQLCDRSSGPVAQIIASGVRNQHLDPESIERAMEEIALQETPYLYKRLGVLDTIITLSPLLGLLGTITGMISAFKVVSGAEGMNAPTAITGGVAEALIATATGLTIAIITLPGYNYLTERVKEIISEMEASATQVLNTLANLKTPEEQTHETSSNRA